MSVTQTRTACDPAALRYVPTGLYTFGCCHYGHQLPYRTGEVEANNLTEARRKAWKALQMGPTEHLRHVETKPNPAFIQEQARWAAGFEKAA